MLVACIKYAFSNTSIGCLGSLSADWLQALGSFKPFSENSTTINKHNEKLRMQVFSKVIHDELERIPSTPPLIDPVPPHVRRPQWSIMIPTYNCLTFLQETIECVLAQAPGPAEMQIVVVDDCSTDGDVESLVKRVGQNRVEYFCQKRNVGSLRNFETCINLSSGEWVHILHGDDLVMPGFYLEIEQLFQQYPETGAAFTNSASTIGSDRKLHLRPLLASSPGVLNDFLIQNAQKLRLQPPSIVVKRKVYEQLGGFYAVHYGEDWEMWTRIAAYYPVAYSPKCLALYRYRINNSITQLAITNGQNIRDIIKVIDIMQGYVPASEREKLKTNARREYALYCVSLANSLMETNRAAALIQARGALEMSTDFQVYLAFIKYFIKYIIGYEKFRDLWQK
ncbi:glycosyltransferase family 2 protein [Hymenobacter volaticus]|uniref:Glycosyltransferase n=1 Tax=Hymenobacter volaticus TaxID=2932254 RepID=A0ABY4GA09_9BACT|nr:glycosyltransferase [Hymenobacter volaticus]UOQ67731.1 glycosyltransferase [Hymenobacter volaticus]